MDNTRIQELTELKRVVCASLTIRYPSETDAKFAALVFARAEADLADMPPPLVRGMYEAACGVEHPSEVVKAFRGRLQRHLATAYRLRAARPAPAPAAPAAQDQN